MSSDTALQFEKSPSTSNNTVISSGREFHQDETSTYWLPKDEEEQLRLTGVSRLLFK